MRASALAGAHAATPNESARKRERAPIRRPATGRGGRRTCFGSTAEQADGNFFLGVCEDSMNLFSACVPEKLRPADLAGREERRPRVETPSLAEALLCLFDAAELRLDAGCNEPCS